MIFVLRKMLYNLALLLALLFPNGCQRVGPKDIFDIGVENIGNFWVHSAEIVSGDTRFSFGVISPGANAVRGGEAIDLSKPLILRYKLGDSDAKWIEKQVNIEPSLVPGSDNRIVIQINDE